MRQQLHPHSNNTHQLYGNNRKYIDFLFSNWSFLIPVFYVFVYVVYVLINGKNIYYQIHDNLDSNVAWFKMLRDSGTWFSHNAMVPFLGGINRNYLCSEFKFYSWIHIIFPTFTAFVFGDIFRTVFAVVSGVFLGKMVLKNNFSNYRHLVVLCSFLYGILPTYPTACFDFASMPLILAFSILLYQTKNTKLLPLFFFYPIFSSFATFGIFICGYFLLFFIIDWIVNKNPAWRMFFALCLISAGYVVSEYRLFYMILFSGEKNLRNVSYVPSYYSIVEILNNMKNVFFNGYYHAGSLQQYLVLPLCIVYFLCLNIQYVRQSEKNKILYDKFNWLIAWFLFNIILYGLDEFKPFRDFVAFICPPISGLSFARGIWFNPFIIHTAFCIALCNFDKLTYRPLKEIYLYTLIGILLSVDTKLLRVYGICIVVFIILLNIQKFKLYIEKTFPYLILFLAILIVPFNWEFYNTIRYNLKNQYLKLNGRRNETSLTYKEFYSEELFDKIKKDINYKGEWSVAYGMHPSVIEYNGISTLDGYLSYYSQNYKDQFRKLIAPILYIDEANQKYFDSWGGRAYIVSKECTYEPLRELDKNSAPIYIDVSVFKEMNGKYIFSRVEIENAVELNLLFRGVYVGKEFDSPYTIYVYEVA